MIRVMRVYYEEENIMHFDFFEKKEWLPIVNSFFLKGAVSIPTEISKTKTKQELTEEDYGIFFEKLGYVVIGFENVDQKKSKSLRAFVKIPNEEVSKKWKK